MLEFQRARLSFLADPMVSKSPSSACPSEDDIRNLAAGLCSEPLARQIRAHADACGRCGPLLQEYIEDFSDSSTPEEQAFLNQLRTSSPKRQARAIREMLKEDVPSGTVRSDSDIVTPSPHVTQKTDSPAPPSPKHLDKSHRIAFPWKWITAPAVATACAIIAFAAVTGIWYARRDTPEKVEQKLAQAYTEQRTMEMRWPGAAYSSYKQTLSGDSESLLNSPESLRTAANLIDSQLKKDPDDSRWLLLSARLNVLDWRYKAALATLDKIVDPKSIDSPQFRMTRALALYEQAESEPERKSQTYGEIINLLGKTLQNSPDDPTALFNQGLACEKIHAFKCAITDYTRLVDKTDGSGWRSEAKDHLDKIKEKKTPDH
jgi:hypothetical protein